LGTFNCTCIWKLCCTVQYWFMQLLKNLQLLWREESQRVNPVLVTCIVICSNVGMCYCLLTGVKMHCWKGLILHLTNDVAFLDIGSSITDLVVVCHLSKVPWCSTVVKNLRLLMFEGSSCKNFSCHGWNFSNHYYFDMVLTKDPWHSSVLYIDAGTFDIRMRVASKFLLSEFLHVNYDVSVYHSTGQCLYFSLPNLISPCHFVLVFFH